MMKYHVFRRHRISNRIEVLRTKCSDNWASLKWAQEHPDRIWAFSRQGAKGIVDRGNARTFNFDYYMEEA